MTPSNLHLMLLSECETAKLALFLAFVFNTVKENVSFKVIK